MGAERTGFFILSLLNGGKTLNGKFKSTAAIIRTYNNRNVATQVRSLLTIGLGRVAVVVDATQDNGATRGYLDTLVFDPRVKVIEMSEGYSWASALNVAIKAVQIANVKQRAMGKQEFRFLFPVSVETQFTREHIVAMLDTATNDPSIGVVGTSFAGRQDGNAVSLGRSYRHPRNTGMLICLEALGALFGGFDTWCDSAGGMEDIDFVLSMLALTNLRYKVLDLQVPLILGHHYHQPTKEDREQSAMRKIIARWRGLFPTFTSERERIESAIATMRLED